VVSSSLVLLPQHDPPIHKLFFHSLILGCAREHFRTICILAPYSSSPMLPLTTLHPKLDGHFLVFLEDYELDPDLKLSFDSFKLTFQHMP